MQQTQTLKPVKLNTDISPAVMPADSSGYILNQEVSINPNGGANGGSSLGKQTPTPANYMACEVEQPSGENYTILKYTSSRTQEAFNGVYNSNGVNYFQRIKTNGQCDIIYVGDCLKFNPAPKHSIEQFRCGMRVEKICKNWSGKELVWCDGDMVSPGCLDYEASIATNFFTTPFFDICPLPCAYIMLCVPEICGCITAEFIPLLQTEAAMSNYIVDKGFKFMVKHIYYDGRASEFSNWSSLYYQQTDCLGGLIGAARCLKLRLPIGNPMVEKIVVAFSEDGGATWYECETVEKYKAYNNTQQQWYERELSEQVSSTFSDADCCFDYIFCNDKNRKTIAPSEFARVRNPLPRKAQSLIQISGKFAFFNYEDGVCPLPKTETEKLSIEPKCDITQTCVPEMVELTIRAILYNPLVLSQIPGGVPDTGYIFRFGGDSGHEPDNPLDTAYYNVLAGDFAKTCGQRFYDKTRNFIVYIEGTEYWAEMKQWRADKYFTNKRLVGVEPQASPAINTLIITEFLFPGGFYYQEAKIKVPKGTRGFLRMASNQASDGSGSSQDTSLPIYGILNDINSFKTSHGGNTSNYPRPDASIDKEIYFDTCNGGIDFKQCFLINTFIGLGSIYNGYVKDNLGFPVEGLTFTPTIINQGIKANLVTDHNGFYGYEGPEVENINIYGETDCNVWNVIKSVQLLGQNQATTRTDIVIDDVTIPYSTTRYAEPEVTIKDCQGNLLPNIKVIISGSKSRDTDAFGLAKFRVRNYISKPRVIKIIVANNGSCITQDCSGGCNPCATELNYTTPSCYNPVPVINVGDIVINNTVVGNKNGLKPGGLYKWSYRVQGNCGRVSAAYEFQEMNIPRLQETLSYQFCDFEYNGTGMILPDWGECLLIGRTANLNPYELQWKVDAVERTIGGNLKLTFQSLNDYNANYFEKTNSVYEFVQGDRVEFISNDGVILNASIYGILNYLILSPFYDSLFHGNLEEPATYFNQVLIKDDGRLSMIKPGAIIEFQRPKQAKEELNPYFDICCVLPLKQVPNGDGTFQKELLNPVGVFNTFDTYFIRRNIQGYVEYFQHHSPSDFWGTKLTDTGRDSFLNAYENEKRYGRNITINSSTQLNYFGDFIKTFDGILAGDIIGAFIQDERDLVLIAEYDSALTKVSNGLLELDRNGNIQAASADQIVSNPADTPFGIYGCQYDDVGSLIEGDGFICWWDSNKMAYVKHNYQIAKDMSLNKVQSYIEKRTIQKNDINNTAVNDLDKLRFITGQNNKTKDVYVTIKRLRDSGINNEKEKYLKLNETFRFNPVIEDFLGFSSFTPEGYSYINLQDNAGCAIISYLNGIAYIHPVIATKFLEWYGVSCDWMLSVCANQFENKEKAWISIEQQSETFFLVDSVETDKQGYLSEIPAIKFKKFGQKWNAGFLGNKNSRSGLYGNEIPKGYYAKILFIRNNTLNLVYQSIDNTKRNAYSELNLILIKSTVTEQSGFTNNL